MKLALINLVWIFGFSGNLGRKGLTKSKVMDICERNLVLVYVMKINMDLQPDQVQ